MGSSLNQDGADEARDGGLVGEDATTSVRRLISPLRRSSALSEPEIETAALPKAVRWRCSPSVKQVNTTAFWSLRDRRVLRLVQRDAHLGQPGHFAR
jgi:hypothetical protein